MRRHQHRPGVRHGLALCERAYELVRGIGADDRVPAAAGGRPTRLVPMPIPRPFGPGERRQLRSLMRTQNTSFSDGDVIRRFERQLANHWGCEHAIAVSSGTGALHAALIAAGIGPGDEVIVPVLTYVSTALAVLYQGATPRFVDAHPESWNLDVSHVAAAITPRTKAIIAVHLCGVPADMRGIRKLAEAHDLLVIEDAAQAHGALYGDDRVGTCGHLGCLSFQSVKTMTTGEGGAVLTDDDELARRVRLAMNLGESTEGGHPTADLTGLPSDARVQYEILGWNYRMSALQAALGLGQLERLDTLCAERNRNAARLWEQLSGIEGIQRQQLLPGTTPCYSSFFTLLDGSAGGPSRDELARALALERIDCRLPYRTPLASHAIFGQPGAFPVATRICDNALGFRVDPSLGRRDVDSVGFAVRRLCAWSQEAGSPTAD